MVFAVLAAVFEAEAFTVHLQNVDMMSKAVEKCTGEAFRAKCAGPFIERQVRCDDGGAALIALGEDLKEKL